MIYLIKNKLGGPVSKNTVVEFEKEIIKINKLKIIKEFRFTKLSYYANDLIFGIFPLLKRFRNKRNKKNFRNNSLFSISMGVKPEVLFPYYLFSSKNKSVYFFDVWENKISSIVKLIELYGIDLVFVSSKQGAELLIKQGLKKVNIEWCPEGINPENYYFKKYKEKDIDILQLGRKYDLYHKSIIDYCENTNIHYLYEKIPQTLIFDTNKKFYDGLSRTKISICFPQNTTHPEIAGNISTMTQRYLQSMLSKCLIIGELPYDMKYLFNYNPIIEVDMKNPQKQLDSILKNYNSYIPLIEKNHKEVIEKHLWTNRVKDISLKLST